MTDLDELAWAQPVDDPTRPEYPPRKCPHPRRDRQTVVLEGKPTYSRCARCDHRFDPVKSRRSRNNRKRGGVAELATARIVGGRKVGPLGQPWDVEMPGYARIQVRKYLRPESLTKIAAELARIGSGAEMAGYIWVQPGRGGEQLIVFRLRDFAERHGIPEVAS